MLVSFACYGPAFYKYLPEFAPMFKGPYPCLALDLFRIPPCVPPVALTLDPAVPYPLVIGPLEADFREGLIPPGCITLGFIF